MLGIHTVIGFLDLHVIALRQASVIKPRAVVVKSVCLNEEGIVIHPPAYGVSPPARFRRIGIGAVTPRGVLWIFRQLASIGPDLPPTMLEFVQDHHVSGGLQNLAGPEIVKINARETAWVTFEDGIVGQRVWNHSVPLDGD